MHIAPSKYRGSWATTCIEPTDQEILFILNNSDELIQTNRIKERSYQNWNDFCDCIDKDRTGYVVHDIALTSKETDVPESSWDDEYRILHILQCPDCKCWVLIG